MPETTKLTMLNVDDNAAALYAKSRILRQAGFDVIEATTGQEALRQVAAAKPALVLLDVKLPDINGFEVCRRIKTDPATTATLVLQISAVLGEAHDRVRGLDSGADGYLVDPIAPAELVASVKALVRLWQREEENRQLLARLQQEIAERKQAEAEREHLLVRAQQACEEAEAAVRSKEEFLAVVSHELRTPLHAMLGWVRILESQPQPDAAIIAQATSVLSRNIDLQRQLIDDLLDFARITSGKLKLEVEPLNLVTVIEAALEVMRPAAEAKGVKLDVAYDAEAGQITGDPARLQQVVWNLLSNAIKFTSKDGRIELQLERAGTRARITVSDTGKGIPPEFLPYVFDRFRQWDSSSTRRHGGVGLGMALVKQLVELHGGEVSVESAGEGQGAAFSVELPIRAVRSTLAERPGTESEVRSVTAAAFTGKSLLLGVRVLVVDDQAEARELLIAVLKAQGAQVMAAAGGAEALAVLEASLKSQPPEVLVCDIAMPDEDGYTVIRKVRALEKACDLPPAARIPAIALTAYAQPQDRVRALIAGFQLHVAKPVEPVELVMLIKTLVDRRGAR